MTIDGFLMALMDASMDPDDIAEFKAWMVTKGIDSSVHRTAAEWWKLWSNYTRGK